MATIRGWKALAQYTNRAPSSVRQWPERGLSYTSDNGVYVFDTGDVDRFKSSLTRSAEVSGDNDANDELRAARVEKLSEETRGLKMRNEVKDQELVVRSDLESEVKRDMDRIKTGCRDWLTDLLNQFPDLAPAEADRINKEFAKLFG